MGPLCELLDWDTNFFARRIARVVGRRLDGSRAWAVGDWCRQEGIDCLYFLADADDSESTAVAEAHGFNLTDVRLTFARRMLSSALPPLAATAGAALRPAGAADVPALEAISRDSFVDSRFYFDGRFPRADVGRMYQVWVRQSVLGSDHVLVLEWEGRPGGFIICRLSGESRGQVPLTCVDAGLRGHGLGRYLYQGALHWFAEQGVDTVHYVTQARNIRAQRLIQQLGFLTESVELWYHKWFEATGREQRRVG